MNQKKLNRIIQDLLELEYKNNQVLHLTAYENQLSEAANYFVGSKLSERYYFGGGKNSIVDMNTFNCLGLPAVEEIVLEAEKALKEMLGGSVVVLNCLSGIHSMMSTILSVSNPGDCIMTVHHDDGGHFATPGILERTGRKNVFAKYDQKNLNFDAKSTAKIFKKNNCKILYLDISYYINAINITDLRKELGEQAIIVFDASHTIGLLMGGRLQSPFNEGADIICANTHKTLPGPQKGLIVFKEKTLGERAKAIIGGCLYSSSHTHHLIALAITILEMKKFGKAYASQIIKNSNMLGKTLTDLGYQVRKNNAGKYSDTHQVHLFIDNNKRQEIYMNLIKNNISTNFDNRMGKKLFARLGTQEVTRRGMKEKEMKQIALILDKAIQGKDVKSNITSLNNRFKKIKYGFDILYLKNAEK